MSAPSCAPPPPPTGSASPRSTPTRRPRDAAARHPAVGAARPAAAASAALGIVTQDRHAPPESGALAKAASGALETVPWVRVVNLARALDEIAEAAFWRIGLTGEAEMTLGEALGPPRVALVLGAEGEGML